MHETLNAVEKNNSLHPWWIAIRRFSVQLPDGLKLINTFSIFSFNFFSPPPFLSFYMCILGNFFLGAIYGEVYNTL